ncbi:MAG TPA: OmpA family protein [Gemmatimonadales bacterium]|jgi:outer membrane protein OmpA-like peptidoglycan-associated protein|nr:OmpA family protein [Gemmatimonadales bacterium]
MQPVLPIVFALWAQQIPLQAGMTLTYVHRNFDRQRDDEIRTWIVRMTDEESVWNAEWVANPCSGPEDHMSRRERLGARELDFARGGTADQTTAEHRPHTLYMLSGRLLRGLRDGETMDMIVPVLSPAEIILGGADTTTGRCHMPQMVSQLVRGEVQRVGNDTTETVIVDGHGVTVPIMHVRAEFASVLDNWHMTGDMWFVDDTAAAWITRIEMKRQDDRTFHMALGTITTPVPGNAIERELADSCRAPVYGFYFAFNSAALDAASQPTFHAVADLLGRHPDWTLAIEGHTDSIGDPAANLTLSDRRANAVRQELLSHYGIAAPRLTAAGRGMAGYVAPNNTLEGRARNRRVDLVRRCGGSPS